MADEQAVRERLYVWCEVALLSADRLGRSYEEFLTSAADHSLYLEWIRMGSPPEWAETVEQSPKRLTFGKQWTMNADVESFVNSAAHVEKCVKILGAHHYPKQPDGPSIREVRNFEEHWEDPFPRTKRAVQANGGEDFKPGVIAAVSQNLHVGNLSMPAVEDWVREVRDVVAQELRDAGKRTPTADDFVMAPPAGADRTDGVTPQA